MKKRTFKNRLQLRKYTISELQQRTLQGGTDPLGLGFVIITSIRVATSLVTNPRVCESDQISKTCPDPEPVDPTQITTIPPSCVRTACDFNC
ncbi:MAG: hypothetical protein AAF617_04905 [Bacteroidota bacterium]